MSVKTEWPQRPSVATETRPRAIEDVGAATKYDHVGAEDHAAASEASGSSTGTEPCDRPSAFERFEWRTLVRAFARHHRSPLNNAIHVVTTPAAVFAVLQSLYGLLEMGLGASVASTGVMLFPLVYSLALVSLVPFRSALVGAIAMTGLALATIAWPLPLIAAAGLFVVAYVGQEGAHKLAGESTYQSHYSDDANRRHSLLRVGLEHTLFLLPLVLVVCVHQWTRPLRWSSARRV